MLKVFVYVMAYIYFVYFPALTHSNVKLLGVVLPAMGIHLRDFRADAEKECVQSDDDKLKGTQAPTLGVRRITIHVQRLPFDCYC
jgi:hypothetical protein